LIRSDPLFSIPSSTSHSVWFQTKKLPEAETDEQAPGAENQPISSSREKLAQIQGRQQIDYIAATTSYFPEVRQKPDNPGNLLANQKKMDGFVLTDEASVCETS
jgi:hypothetical protein